MAYLASIISPWFTNNECFDLSSPLNRDNSLRWLVELRRYFLEYNIELNTPDVNSKADVLFELHINVQKSLSDTPRYLLMLETPLIHPLNSDAESRGYNIIFTWDDRLVGKGCYHKINFPNYLVTSPADGFSTRPDLCCIIASNKAPARKDRRELYSERVNAIRWFEKNELDSFALYGAGWHVPPIKVGLRGKLIKLIWRQLAFLDITHFPSYKGLIKSKSEVLKHTRFSICFENAQGFPGYITEKIFDCFNSGCVPIYWGAPNIKDYIPSSCFIDYRDFMSMQSVFEYISRMSEEDFRGYQVSIEAYLKSKASVPFRSSSFSSQLAGSIAADLSLSTSD